MSELPLGPGDFALGSLESRVAARELATGRAIKISITILGTRRPASEPKPERRWPGGGGIERFYIDDDDRPLLKRPQR
jgi:hypothetical protein